MSDLYDMKKWLPPSEFEKKVRAMIFEMINLRYEQNKELGLRQEEWAWDFRWYK